LGQSAGQLASLPDAQNDQNLKFEREDWIAGVPVNRLRQLDRISAVETSVQLGLATAYLQKRSGRPR
jgi:hypothetical protein